VRAVVQRGYGGTETWSVQDRPEPVPGKGEVLVDVRAAAIDKGTWHLMIGEPYLVRPFLGMRGLRQPVPGRDVAGVVVAVGEGVTDYGPGDEVYGSAPSGSLAERAVVSVKRLGHRPRSLTFEQAAAVPISGWTALQALRHGGAAEGQRVMVIGASGGVGSYAVQLAASYGCDVTGTCSTTKIGLLKDLGVKRIVDHSRQDPTDVPGERFDLVLEIGTSNRPLRDTRRLLTPTGTLMMVGGGEHGRVLGGQGRVLRALVGSAFSRQRLKGFVSSENAEDLAELTRLADAGAFRPAVDRVFPLADAAKAMDHLASGHAQGKVVVTA
jgi:NADPH:quinone reductase-like Zn-dependent oxidoreductase